MFFSPPTPPPPLSQNISRDGGSRVSEQFSDHCPGLTTMMSGRWVLTCCCYLPSYRENVLNVNTVFCFSESRTCRLATSDKPTLGSIYSSRVFTGVIRPMAAGGSGENSSKNGPGCGLGWRATTTSLRKLRNWDGSSEPLNEQKASLSLQLLICELVFWQKTFSMTQLKKGLWFFVETYREKPRIMASHKTFTKPPTGISSRKVNMATYQMHVCFQVAVGLLSSCCGYPWGTHPFISGYYFLSPW